MNIKSKAQLVVGLVIGALGACGDNWRPDKAAADDSFTVGEDSGENQLAVLQNDADFQGDPLDITSITQAMHGTVVITGNGTGISYRPDANYFGPDSFEYGFAMGSAALVTIDVTAVEDAAVAVADAVSVDRDSAAAAVLVLANDTDVDGGLIEVIAVTQPVNGAVLITGGGSGLTYQPGANFSGLDFFTYTLNGGSSAIVSINVGGADQPPVAVNDLVAAVEDTTLTFDVTTNDLNADGGPITITSVTQPANGTVTINANNTLQYVPTANTNGTDMFAYTLIGGSVANVTMQVAPVNDAPTFVAGPNQVVAENAGPQLASPWATMISSGPNESGQTLTVTITNNTNPNLFAVGPVITSSGDLTYTAAANTSGTATITFTVTDSGGTAMGGSDTTAPQSFTITVQPLVGDVNDAPSFTRGPDQTVLEDANPQVVAPWATMLSSGPANESTQTLSFIVTNNTNAALFVAGPAISPSGTLTYTLAPNQFGTAAITITLRDSGGTANGGVDTSAPQTFTITVGAVNDAPRFTRGPDQTVAVSSAQTVDPWATAIAAGPANESAQNVSFEITGNTQSAIFAIPPTVTPSGALSFTTGSITGTTTITLRIRDTGGVANGGVDTSATQTFRITNGTGVVDPPGSVNLGSLTTYVAVAGAGLSNSNVSGITTLNGDVGLSPTGTCLGDGVPCTATNPVINGEFHANDAIAAQAKADLTAAYNDAAGRPVGTTVNDITGMVLAPGVYTSGSTMSIAVGGTVTLDGQGDDNAVWIFQVGSSLTVNNNATVKLVNGARSRNVYWAIFASSTLGTDVSFHGSILAGASNTVGTDSVVVGRLLCRDGIITLLSNNITLPPLFGPSPTSPVDLGSLSTFVAVAGDGLDNVNTSGPTILTGDLGLSPNATCVSDGQPCTVNNLVTNGTTYANDVGGVAAQAQSDLDDAFLDAMSLPGGTSANDLSGLVLIPGTYTSASTMSIAAGASISLDAQGNPNAVWVFQVGSTLAINNDAQIRLLNGARAKNVYFAVVTSATLGSNVSFQGNLMAASITTGGDAVVVGRLLARTGALTMTSSNLTLPPH